MPSSSDPHGHHDWHSQDYVDHWITSDVTRDEQRRRLLDRMITLIPLPLDASIRVLDVGAGYGLLSSRVLGRFENAQVVCQDFSLPMLNHAKERLSEGIERITFIESDLMTPDWVKSVDGPFDAVVSAIAIHNVRFPDRIRAIYEEISGILVSGGCFLNCDLVFNKSADLKTQLNWLRELGLERVQCFEEYDRTAIFGGFRS